MNGRLGVRVALALSVAAVVTAACLFPTEGGGQYRIVFTKRVGLLFLGDTARVEAVVVDGDSVPQPSITVNYQTEAGEVLDVDGRTGLLRGVQEGVGVVQAFAPGWRQAELAADTVQVLLGSGSGVDSYGPGETKFGDTVTIVGSDLGPSQLTALVFGGVGYDSAGIVHRFAQGDRDTLVLWVLPPAPEDASLLLVRSAGSAVVLPVQVEQVDVLEPNADAAPRLLSTPFRNPGLTIDRVDIDTYEVAVAAGKAATVTLLADPARGVELSVRSGASGSALWPASTRTWCHGVSVFQSLRNWQVEEQRVALRSDAADTLTLRVVAREVPSGELVRYGLTVDTSYVSALAPDEAEENDWCETAFALPTGTPGDSLASTDTSLALNFDNAPDLDWFRLDLDRPRVVTVWATPDSTGPMPDLYLFRDLGDSLALHGQRAAHDETTVDLDSLALSLDAGPYLLLATNLAVGEPALAVATYALEVRSEEPVVASVALDRERVTMASGLNTRLRGVVVDQIGNVVTDAPLEWTSSDTTVATVISTGRVSAFIPAEGTDSAYVIVRSTDFPDLADSALIVVVRDDVTWTWMSGSATPNQRGTYGTQGVASGSNAPGGRAGASAWTDASGDFWLFGGSGYDAAGTRGLLSDLWRFDGVSWTWVAGNSTAGEPGVYGTQGQPDPRNGPGGREGAATWVDGAGNLWMFGGYGLGQAPDTVGRLNDLWRFDGVSWTWVSGSPVYDQSTVYETQGDPDLVIGPGGRNGAVGWIDAQDRLWLFGGDGFGPDGNLGWHDDLWRFDGGTWTRERGLEGINLSGAYDALGSLGYPGGRWASAAWQDAAGSFWLYGGEGVGNRPFLEVNGTGRLNDLWRLDGTGFTWISGDSLVNQEGVYGLGVPTDSTDPGGRSRGPLSWTRPDGTLWLFGGEGVIDGIAGFLNDLWRFDGSRWTWMSGNAGVNEPGVYGTKGVGSIANVPPGREAPVGWTDAAGNLWLFGGGGRDASGNYVWLNDLWRAEP